jgi:23S rRNA pseudouridine1911/1915/1917 synthase
VARTYRFVIGASEAGARLDHYLVRRLPAALSRALVQRVIRAGGVTIGGRPVKTHRRLHAGDVISATFAQVPAPPSDRPDAPQPIPLDVIHEDEHVLVVNKPAGLVTHPAPGHWDGTLVNAILWHLQHARGSGEFRIADFGLRIGTGRTQSTIRNSKSTIGLPRAGLVHRLDKDTSGLLLVAKTAAAHTLLARQLAARVMRRRYLAVVEGWPAQREGTVRAAIGRHHTHRKEMAVRHLGGRSAVTHYRVVAQRHLPPDPARAPAGLRYAVLEVSLETGRTHQIRVHLAHLGHPVLGDVTYGKRPRAFWTACGVGRQLLHAYRLQFVHPATKRLVSLTAPVPADLRPWVPEAAHLAIAGK